MLAFQAADALFSLGPTERLRIDFYEFGGSKNLFFTLNKLHGNV